MDETLLDCYAAAELLGISVFTLRKWMKSKKINAVRLAPRVIRIERSEIRRIITAGTTITSQDGAQ
jgi:excisionase family DNA binding protein